MLYQHVSQRWEYFFLTNIKADNNQENQEWGQEMKESQKGRFQRTRFQKPKSDIMLMIL